MSRHPYRRRTLESLKKEAKQWLAAIRAGAADPRARLTQALPDSPAKPTLHDVQLALARLNGFPGWAALKRALSPDIATSTRTLAQYREMADALLDAYRSGTPESMARYYRFTALNLDARELAITAAGMAALVPLSRLGWLAADAKDDWMPHIAAMRRLRFLGVQDTVAGDDGFKALARSSSLEYSLGPPLPQPPASRFPGAVGDAGPACALRQLPECGRRGAGGAATLPRASRADADGRTRRGLPTHRPVHGARIAGADVLPPHHGRRDRTTRRTGGAPVVLQQLHDHHRPDTHTARPLDALQRVTFDNCHQLTNTGIAELARLPRLAYLRVNSHHVTRAVRAAFAVTVAVDVEE